ncbi:ATP-dependent DNA helicase RecG [Carnobacteriaceae bacterium zg-C25]|nr:ATP-dependent DNA helicase RecG [Carnobacteriaceae bacterium zg-C25]
MLSLQDSVRVLPGVGDKRLEALKDLGITTINDLLFHFPFRYEDMSVRHLDELIDQDKVTLKGVVLTTPVISFYGGKKNRLSFKMAIDEHIIGVYFFNQHYLKSRIVQGEEVVVFGKWEEKKQAILGMKLITPEKNTSQTFDAVYHVNKSIKQQTIIQLVKYALDEYEDLIMETMPKTLLQKYNFISLKQAIRAMHFPNSLQEHHIAKQRMIYQELFEYQFKLSQLKKERYTTETMPIAYDNQRIKAFVKQIPFELTNAQKRVSNDICRDLLSPFAMNRLLQGDVGSGKTVVASIGILAAIDAGYQVALMVPTEILAQQHFQTLSALLDKQGVRTVLLTSSTKLADRKVYLQQLEQGDVDLVIGTHALIQNDVYFKHLGLVIIDEQHRFGVMQRQLLKNKASVNNVLYMTATPIPRTLTMSMYGEMDVSIIDELPKGRQVVQTKWAKVESFDKVLDFTKKQIEQGRQAYFIAPLIEESQESDLQSAQALYDTIQDYYQGTITMALLHGKMKVQEKEDIMNNFSAGNIQLLVSTTVIEVGVNVPNATVMIIHDAERFGLAQLHQLRGRVGRGSYQSYCVLIASPKTQQGKERMKIMCESNDGFYLSQKDLEMRGGGDAFGAKQSGMPLLKCADLIRDVNVWQQVIEDVRLFLKDDTNKEYLLLKERLFDKMELV